MSLDDQILQSHKTTISGASTVQDQKDAVEAYYDYLISVGNTDSEPFLWKYGAVAKNVALDTGTYGQLANAMLTAAGADTDLINEARVAVAVADIDARLADIGGAGDGVLPMVDVKTYHFTTFQGLSTAIPKEAWGASLIADFVGDDDWLDIAYSGDFSALNLADIIAISDAVKANTTSGNGVNARTAMGYALEAVGDLPGGATAEVVWDSSGFLFKYVLASVDMLTFDDQLPNSIYISDLEYFFHGTNAAADVNDVSDALSLNANETLTNEEGAYTLEDTTQAISESRVVLIANTLNSALLPDDPDPLFKIDDEDVCTVTDNAGTRAYQIVYDPMSDTVLGLIGGTAGKVVDGTGSGETINSGFYDAQGDNVTNDNDTIIGNGGNDVLYGGAGNDTYVWRPGDDHDAIGENEGETNLLRMDGVTSDEFFLTGTTGWPYGITARYSSDGGATVSGSVGQAWMYYGTSAMELRYIVLDDAVYDLQQGALYRAVDTASGERIDANPMIDTDDTMVGSTSDNDTLYGYGGEDSITGGGGANSLYGGNGDDTIEGGGGADQLFGEAGDDIIEGGTGDDALYGGAGNDTYIWRLGDGNDGIAENEGETNTLILDGVTSDQFFLTGTYGWYPHSITARVSTDDGATLNGSVAVGFQNYGTANVELRYIVLDDVTYDTHAGVLWRAMDMAGNEAIHASTWYDGDDTMVGSASDNDTLYGYGGEDSITGGGGANSLYGGNGEDTIEGGAGNDTIYGGNDDDFMLGGADYDNLFGENGNDTLNGGTGNDGLYGGAGDDTYIVGATDGQDYIYDYSGNNVLDIDLGAVDESAHDI